MNFKKFNYYGFDKNSYMQCLDMIHSTNLKHIGILNIFFIIYTGLFSIFSIMGQFGVNRRNFNYYMVFFVAFTLFELFLVLGKKYTGRIAIVLTYIQLFLIVSFAIVGSLTWPYYIATTFLVMVVICSLSYIDNMLRMSIALILSSAVLLYTSYKGLFTLYTPKPNSHAVQDTYNVVVFLSLSLILHYAFQKARMGQFETYQRNLQISRDLEVKSSFDALTSLLNRGRFFSMAGEVLRNHSDEYIVVAILDLDKFKQINDTLGHQMGDKVIQTAGSTILDSLNIDLADRWSFPERALNNKLCFAGRLGGDEFVVMIRGKQDRIVVSEILSRMLYNLNSVEMGELHGIHASFGATEVTAEDRDIDTVYRRADEALYQSKRGGKNQVTFG